MSNYYIKYLKYKLKYENLRKSINLIGGGKETARTYFISKFLLKPEEPILDEYKKYTTMSIKELLNPDGEFAKLPKLIRKNIMIIRENEKNTENYRNFILLISNDISRNNISPIIIPKIQNETELNNLFNKMYEGILHKYYNDSSLLEKHINFIIISYINNTFGRPSSFENIGRFKQAKANFDLLKNNSKISDDFTTISQDSLNKLEDYLDKPDIKINLDKLLKAKEIEIAAELTPIFITPNVLVYNPKTEEQSRKYGANTRWCTAARENCKFNNYNYDGPLYIIISRSNPTIKFQLHIESDSLMDASDNVIEINKMLEFLNNDSQLYIWLEKLVLNNFTLIVADNEFVIGLSFLQKSILNLTNSDILLSSFQEKYKMEINITQLLRVNNIELLKNNTLINKSLSKIKFLTFDDTFNQPFGNSLDELVNLENLSTEGSFNQSLGNSLDNLVKLRQLFLTGSFNKSLGNSLDNLGKLEKLHLGNNFNQPLGNSLDNLVKLRELTFGNNFNQPLGNSLNNLKELRELTFGTSFELRNLPDYLKTLPKIEQTLPNLELIIKDYHDIYNKATSYLIDVQ